MKRYQALFLDESRNHLREVEDRLVAADAFDRDALDEVFRQIHSLKGMAAAMGYAAMADLAHRLEDRLDEWRTAGTAPDGARDLCLRARDRLEAMRDDVAAGGDGDLDWTDLAPDLTSRAPAPDAAPAGLAVTIRLDPDCASPAARAYLILLRFRELDPEVRSVPSEAELLQGPELSRLDLTVHGADRGDVERLYETLTEVAGLDFPADGATGDPPGAAGSEASQGPEETAEPGDPAGPDDGEGAASPPVPEDVEPPVVPPEEPIAGRRDGEEPAVRLPETVQAPVALLDEFVDLLGEMTIARSHLEDTARTLGSDLLREEIDRLGKLVRSFHTRVMGLRMLPFSLITGSLKRLVREHAARLGKEAGLVLSGEEIGMDKSILLQVSDPLVHLLRNALDHGLEPPEERVQKGKPARGTIEVRAARARNRVEITVADDGRGIDVEAVRQAAVAAGLHREPESRRLGNAEVLACLFRPGFTTRNEVSEWSGRGVGLDVVKSKVEGLGGTIEVTSSVGSGTRFRLSLPLSVAIVPVLMVTVGDSVLALPTANVVRTVEAQPRDIRKKEGVHVLLTEQGQVPILSLARVLRLDGRQRFDRVPLVLAQTGAGVTALAVDGFVREEDLFIKPLRGPFRALRGLSGYSVLGDGRLVFLLDPPTLFTA